MIEKQENTTRERIENAIMEFSPKITLDLNTSFDDVKTIIRVFMRSHPEIFWFSNQYKYDEKSGILKFRYNFTREKTDFFKGEIGKVIKDDFQIDYVKTLSEIERLVYVYKWIALRTTYNEYSSFNQTIYSVLINRNSVCTGYAKTAQYLLRLVGMESQLVFGKFHSDKSKYGRHGWNIVKVNGKWYHIDFCLADTSLGYLLNNDVIPIEEDSILWNYFGVTVDTILQNRSIEFVETLPLCKDILPYIPKVDVLKPQKQLICCKSDSGTSAKIYLDSFNKNKVIKVSRNENLELLQNEARVLSKLSGCPHIIKSYGLNDYGLELEQLTPWSELLNSHYYNPTESDLNDILRQLIEGLIECRNKGITYSDIHYNNVFVTKDGKYKWGDFGIAFSSQGERKLPTEMIGENDKPKGSYWFMAPETYHEAVFTEASAIYSVAMMAYFVMNNMRPPFWIDSNSENEALLRRINGENIPTPSNANRYPNLWNSIRQLLLKENLDSYSNFDSFIDLLGSIRNIQCPRCKRILRVQSLYLKSGKSIKIKCPNCNTIIIIRKPIDSTTKNNIPADYSCHNRWGDGRVHDTDSFACTAAIPGNTMNILPESIGATVSPKYKYSAPKEADPPAPGSSCPSPSQPLLTESYGVYNSNPKEKRSIWSQLFGKKEKSELINASAYAPAEIKPQKNFIVRIFLHKPEESNRIDLSVKDVDKSAVKKANKPLDIPVKEGDRISVQLSMSDGTTIDESLQNVVWRGRYIECDFICKLTVDDLTSIWGKAVIAVNNVPSGHLKFELDVVHDEPRQVYAKAEVKRFSKIFISYAHADYQQVRGIAEGCKMNGSDYFFDRHTLQAGDIFKDKILQYIDNADLFVLCWSKNAAESEWVQIERKHALALIEKGDHQLAIYPLSMPPEAPLPEDMSDKYNFATL